MCVRVRVRVRVRVHMFMFVCVFDYHCDVLVSESVIRIVSTEDHFLFASRFVEAYCLFIFVNLNSPQFLLGVAELKQTQHQMFEKGLTVTIKNTA